MTDGRSTLGRPGPMPGNGPQLLLKLACHGAFDRPVAGVMGPGRNFIDQETAGRGRA